MMAQPTGPGATGNPKSLKPAVKKPVGRPTGPESTIVNVRIPLDLLERLDRYLDQLEIRRGIKANRGMITRQALAFFLDTEELG
jgi:hypothetical protein